MRYFFVLIFFLFAINTIAQENLFHHNAGFEENDVTWSNIIDDWHYKRWGESTMNTARNTESAHAGTYGVSISISSTGGATVDGMAGLRREATGLEANNTYKLSFYIQAENSGDQEVLVSVGDFISDPVVPIYNTTLSYQGGGEWRLVETTFSTDVVGSDYSQIRFDIDFRSAVGKYYVDDFELVSTVVKDDQSITFDAIPQKQVNDADFQLTATASSGLSVSYSSSNPEVATVTGDMVTIINDGITYITASQPGNEDYNEAEDVIRILFVTDPAKTNQTITFPAMADRSYGDPAFTLPASSSSSLPIDYIVISGPITISGDQATITGAGQASIQADQDGDDVYNAALPVTQTLTISKAGQTINIDAIPNVGVNTRPFDVEASTTSNLPLEYSITGPATISGTLITLDGTEGTVTVTVSQDGDDNYNAASENTSFDVVSCEMPGIECFDGLFYVSKSGDDLNPGTQELPFLTIQRAADEMLDGEECIISEGVYREKVTLNSDGVTFRAVDGDEVVISAFDEISDWQLHAGLIYKTSIPVNLDDENAVMFEDSLMILARWPNKTNFNPFDLEAAYGADGSDTYLRHSEIPDQNFDSGGTLWFLGKSRWTSWRWPISENTTGEVTYDQLPSDWNLGGSHNPSGGGEFILYNSMEALDSNGEWYMDRTTRTLYFRGPNDEDLTGIKVDVRQRTTLFDLQNRVNVMLDGLKLKGGNIRLEGAKNCTLKNLEILHGTNSLSATGNNSKISFRPGIASIQMNNSSSGNTIDRCNIQWGSASGLIINGNGNVIQNNYIGNFNHIGSYAAPIRLSGTNQIIGNEIYNGGRDLINGGGNGAEISYNDLYASNLMNDDCGAIYMCCGKYGDTRIHHNYIHDIHSRNEVFSSYKGCGVYLDNSTEDVIVDHNVMWNLEWTGVQINWAGVNLLIYNNTIWSNDGPNSKTMGRWVNGYEFTNVPVYNTLANDDEFHATDIQGEIVLALDADPFEGFSDKNFMPKLQSEPIDAGIEIAGYTDGHIGEAPDAGAYERGKEYWVPGPDWIPDGVSKTDCNGEANGSAFIDKCGTCVGGSTGLEPETGDCASEPPPVTGIPDEAKLILYPNPASDEIFINALQAFEAYQITDFNGRIVGAGNVVPSNGSISLSGIPKGGYLIKLSSNETEQTFKLIVK